MRFSTTRTASQGWPVPVPEKTHDTTTSVSNCPNGTGSEDDSVYPAAHRSETKSGFPGNFCENPFKNRGIVNTKLVSPPHPSAIIRLQTCGASAAAGSLHTGRIFCVSRSVVLFQIVSDNSCSQPFPVAQPASACRRSATTPTEVRRPTRNSCHCIQINSTP